MHIKFEDKQLLEFFDTHNDIFEDGTEFSYNLKDNLNIKLNIYISAYQQIVSIALSHENLNTNIISFDIKNVTKIEADLKKLIIFFEDINKQIIIHSNPYINFEFVNYENGFITLEGK